MAKRKALSPSTALRRLGSGGVKPTVAGIAPLANRLSSQDFGARLEQLWPRLRAPFNEILAAEGGGQISSAVPSECPDLSELDRDEVERLLGFLQIQTLAYGSRTGSPHQASEGVEQVLAALGEHRAWSTSTLYRQIDPDSLQLPRGGYGYGGCGPLFSNATFEETVILLSPSRAVIVMWTDED